MGIIDSKEIIHFQRKVQFEDGAATMDSITFHERPSDKPAPRTDHGELYVRDNGAGKTQLVIRFPTGAIQIIATEP